jgi:hypothetical protein
MAIFPSVEWFDLYKKAVEKDPEMKCVSQYFNADFLLDFGGKEFLFKVRDGRILKVVEAPTLDDYWEFAIRWPLEDWKKFKQPVPPPMHNDLFAAMYGAGCTFQGDTRVFMGNLKALFRMLAVMRDVQA